MAVYDMLQKDEIRVLCLEPGVYDTPLCTYLEVVSLDMLTYEQSYEAISHAWGPRVFDHELQIEGIGKIFITETLYHALQRLRPVDDYRRLWIDALCIDQNNTAERSSQVAMMGKIFSSAWNVVIWLGESEPSDCLAFATINFCRPAKEEFAFEQHASGGGATLYMDNAVSKSLLDIDAELVAFPYCPCCETPLSPTANTALDGLLAAKAMLRRSWFQRLWVVQEIVLGAEVHIVSGSHCAEWAYFSGAMFRLFSTELNPSEETWNGSIREGWFESAAAQIQHFESFRLLDSHLGGRKRPSGVRLLSSILELSARDCYEPRDRVYAVRSITGLEDSGDFLPDYESELSAIYRSVCVRSLIDKTWRQTMLPDVSLVLGLAGTEDTAAAELERPSWVPHFHHLTKRSRTKARAYDFKGLTHDPSFISPHDGMTCQWSPQKPQILMLKGRCFGVVREILADSHCPQRYPEDESASSMNWSDIVPHLIEWYLRCKSWICESTKESVDIEEILCAGDPRKRDWKAGLSRDAFGQFCSELMLPDEFIDQMWSELRQFLIYQLSARLDRDRLLAAIDIEGNQRFGWIPPQGSVGDFLCIVPGAPWPFAIRKNGDDSYILLGDAYVQGVDTFAALDCHAFGPQPLPFGAPGVGSRSKAEAAAEADLYVNRQMPFNGQDPFGSSTTKDFNESAARLDSLVESMSWIALH